MKIAVLGLSAMQTGQWETSNYCVQAGSTTLVLDCGPGVVRQLHRAGVALADISHVVITHAHGDHVAGFAYLAFSVFVDRATNHRDESTLHVYAPAEIIPGLELAVHYQYPPGRFPLLDIRYHPLSGDPDVSYSLQPLSMRAVKVQHAVPTIGIRLDDTESGGSASFSSDTVFCEPFASLSRGVGVMFHEAMRPNALAIQAHRNGHATPEDAARVAQIAQPKLLCLTHLHPDLLPSGDSLISEVRSSYSGAVIVPDELQIISVDRLNVE